MRGPETVAPRHRTSNPSGLVGLRCYIRIVSGMAYRDDRQALAMQLAELERENERLRDALEHSEARARELADAKHEQRRAASRDGCSLCGGTLLPVAVFAGHDIRSPLPLSISTIRFGRPTGGFTHSAPVRSLVCASCGYIHNFIDMAAAPRSLETHLAESAAEVEGAVGVAGEETVEESTAAGHETSGDEPPPEHH
jgi:hypothetical protein